MGVEGVMESVESKVFGALSQAPFTVRLGGRDFEFRPMSLSDFQEISVISESIKVETHSGNAETHGRASVHDDEDVFKDAIAAGKYARQIAEIISIGAHVRGDEARKEKKPMFYGLFSRDIDVVTTEKERREEVFNYAYYHADIHEVYGAIVQIFAKGHPAFFLNITTTLSLKNILTPTKETEATAPGQSKPE